MGVKKYKPATPGTRFKVGNAYEEVTTNRPEKTLLHKYTQTGGRNNKGRMSTKQRGGGHKQKYRVIDFKRNKEGIPARVKSIEYDPNRSAFIALLYYKDGEKRYIIAPEGLEVGQEVNAGSHVKVNVGNALPLKSIPLGSVVHNIELHPGKGGSLVRSAGSYAQLVAKDGKYAILKLASGESRMILQTCKATIGSVSNPDHILCSFGKAGTARWRGRRPRTRAVAMNPVDHPMGGGEGKKSGGHPRSRTSLYTKGKKTRNPNKASSRLIISRKRKKKK